MGVYIGEPVIISDMQGPAPDGFHVPTKDEWVSLIGILTSTFHLADNSSTVNTYLKIPNAGKRDYRDSAVDLQGTYGFYWTVNKYDSENARCFVYSNSGTLNVNSYQYMSQGSSIRCFKNSPVVPTASWTKLYDGSSVAAGAGVFWSSSLGLISISGNGTTWITIADKNLGATQVYNSGNTLSEAKCGKYYQWGNNYGFPRTGSVTTSSTKVNASTYGPGNYYSSSTFIAVSSSPRNWDSSSNANIRGGVSQGTTIRGELKNAYIGGLLKSYEEIVAMATTEGGNYTNTLAELNTFALDYYNLFNGISKMNDEDNNSAVIIDGRYEGLLNNNGYFFYSTSYYVIGYSSLFGWNMTEVLR